MTVQPVEWAGLAAGVALVTGTLASVVHTLVLPRKPRGLAARAPATVWAAHLAASRGLGRYADKDRILALAAPASLLALLAIWLITLLLGYALILWPLGRQTYGAAVVHAGSALFTLGLSSAGRPLATAVGFAAAATGLGIVALEIAYLPTLYSAYSRREALVTLLEGRAGSPAWGVELLARHQLAGILDRLPALYDEWERWAADVAESHTTYPVLAYFRSPRPLDSWITGQLAVLDSAALYLAVCPSQAPSESRLCLRMGFTCLRDIADALGIGYDPDPAPDGPIALSYRDFASAVGELLRVGFPVEQSAESAWPQFRGWRVNYEAIITELATLLLAPPAPWTGRAANVSVSPLRPVDRRPGLAGPPGQPRRRPSAQPGVPRFAGRARRGARSR